MCHHCLATNVFTFCEFYRTFVSLQNLNIISVVFLPEPPNWWGGVQGLFRVADDNGRPCVTETSAKLCWDPPRSDGGAHVTGYFLE